MKYTCYIFARGGSKGIKNKNIIKLNGKPLIYYTIREAKKSKYINRIVVSTDDIKIKKIARKLKVEVLNRPKKLAHDNTPELEAWKHAIETEKNKFKDNDLFISLPTTSPLRNVKDINNGINKYIKSKYDLILGITPSYRNPYLNMVKIHNHKIKLINSKKNFIRRQDAPKVYDITTVIYVSSRKYIAKCKKIMEGKNGYIIIPKNRSLDIDDNYDLEIANYFIKKNVK